ncbi:helix-turn-helix domain-containing protein [Clostridium sp. HCP1S3_B4]|uniref:helix-turn-helix domain-containing protein n=1 Tax=unclassified Clostridium TaxID=2614128 RepID=UPI00169CEFEC|nr:helix-turn-helix domain-containing protein [Clostridiales bacterium]
MEILTLGEKIKRKRKKLNMTLKDLAKERITPGQISLVESGRSNPSMDLLEYLAENLNTTVEYLMESEESQAEKITMYYEQLAESFILSHDFETAEDYLEKASEYANKYELEFSKGKLLYLKGIILEENKDLEVAQQNYLSANVIFVKNNKYENVIDTFLRLTKISIKAKAYHSANSYLKQAEIVYLDNNIGNDVVLGEIYYYMSKVYFSLENFKQSLKYAFLAEEKFEGVYDKDKYSKSLLLIAQNYSENNDLENALIYSNKALEVQKKVVKNNNISDVENNLGELFCDLNKIENSFKHYNRAKEIKIINKSNNLNVTLINMCKNYIKEKDIVKCEELLNKIYDRLTENDIVDRLNCDLIKYRILCIKERTIEAENLLIDIYNYAKKSEVNDFVSELCIMISKFYLDNKKDNLAKKYLDEAVNIYKKMGLIEE